MSSLAQQIVFGMPSQSDVLSQTILTPPLHDAESDLQLRLELQHSCDPGVQYVVPSLPQPMPALLHVTATFVTSAPITVPELFEIEHDWPLGCVKIVTAYIEPFASGVMKMNAPSAVRGRSSPP